MFVFWNVCSQLEQRGCEWVIAKGKCYILMEAVRGAILLKHISFAFFPPPFQHHWQSGSAYRRNLCNIYACSRSYKLLSVSKSTMIEYSDFCRFKDALFTINNLSSLSPLFYRLYEHLYVGTKTGASDKMQKLTIALSRLSVSSSAHSSVC
jgi:hypothetical protein